MQILFRYNVMLYVIILIQILIRYNVKNLITACTRSLDFDLKIEKSPYPGPPSQTLPPLGRFAPSGLGRSAPSHNVTFPLGAPPPQCVDPRYATVGRNGVIRRVKIRPPPPPGKSSSRICMPYAPTTCLF